jgi:hypothetical protein
MQSRQELDHFYCGVAANTVDEIKESFSGALQWTVRLCPLVREAHPALPKFLQPYEDNLTRQLVLDLGVIPVVQTPSNRAS